MPLNYYLYPSISINKADRDDDDIDDVDDYYHEKDSFVETSFICTFRALGAIKHEHYVTLH